MKQMRMQPDDRRRMILVAAGKIAREKSLASVNHGDVAKRCPVQTSKETVKRYFATQRDLWIALADGNDDLRKQAVDMGVVDQ